MELKKTNVLGILSIVLGMFFMLSCGGNEQNESKSDTEKDPKIVLNEFKLGNLKLQNEFDTLILGDSSNYNSPLGFVNTREGLLVKNSDTVYIQYVSYDSLVLNFPLQDLVFGKIYSEFGETSKVEINSKTDSSLVCKINDSILFDFRKGKNFTILLKHPLKQEIVLGEMAFIVP